MPKVPVIILAFANDRSEGGPPYLRNIPNELRGIRGILEPIEDEGLCELVLRPNATLKEIIDVFQDKKYRGRIAIFHYGGHSEEDSLLLETNDGNSQPAHRKGVVELLAGISSLKLIFLNGCYSETMAREISASGEKIVIGTHQNVNDEIACNIAIRFYNGLKENISIKQAWNTAMLEQEAKLGDSMFREAFQITELLEEEPQKFPWDIYGDNELILEWVLSNQLLKISFPIQSKELRLQFEQIRNNLNSNLIFDALELLSPLAYSKITERQLILLRCEIQDINRRESLGLFSKEKKNTILKSKRRDILEIVSGFENKYSEENKAESMNLDIENNYEPDLGYEYDIFISYDDNALRDLWVKDILRYYLKNYVYDELGISPSIYCSSDAQNNYQGAAIRDSILSRSKCFIPICSTPFFVKKSQCTKELSLMLHRNNEAKQANLEPNIIFPVYIQDKSRFPDMLHIFEDIDCSKFYNPNKEFINTKTGAKFTRKLREFAQKISHGLGNSLSIQREWAQAEWMNAGIENYEANVIRTPNIRLY